MRNGAPPRRLIPPAHDRPWEIDYFAWRSEINQIRARHARQMQWLHWRQWAGTVLDLIAILNLLVFLVWPGPEWRWFWLGWGFLAGSWVVWWLPPRYPPALR